MVPGSTLMYGSSFCSVTRRPLLLSSRPRDEAVRPLPRLLATPPVTKMCLVTGSQPTAALRAGGTMPLTSALDCGRLLRLVQLDQVARRIAQERLVAGAGRQGDGVD